MAETQLIPEKPANTGVLVNCAFSEMATVADLIHHPKNPNQHSEGQLDFIRKVIEHQGWRSPLIISNLSGFVVCGNGRLMAARLMGLETVPIDRQDFANEADEIAHLLADNKIASMAELDNDLLKGVLSELDTGAIDMDLTGFADAEFEQLMTQFHVDEAELPTLPEGDGSGLRQVTFTLTDAQALEVNNAIQAAKSAAPFDDTGNENSNGCLLYTSPSPRDS